MKKKNTTVSLVPLLSDFAKKCLLTLKSLKTLCIPIRQTIEIVDLKGCGRVVFIMTELPRSLDQHMSYRPEMDSAFPKAPADLLWISTRAALSGCETEPASVVF